MNTEEIEATLAIAARLAEEGRDVCCKACQLWQLEDYDGFTARMREGIKKLASAAVMLDALATECERFRTT